MLKPLPAGTPTFRDIINGGFLYVDKTKWIHQMVRDAKGIYFLSRPRRFGKSLMVSTLAEIFQGNRALFEGLWIHESDYQWQKHPVIRIDFSQKPVENLAGLKLNIKSYLARIAEQNQVVLSEGRYFDQFEELIYKLSARGQVVILIDEYDKPIIDHLTNLEEATKIRDTLKGFYNVIKASDEYLRFVFLTGISKFSKVGVFSGLNNLTDMTMSPAYSDALGITQEELTSYFTPYIRRLAEVEGLSYEELLPQIRHWYDGFCFSRRCQHVYNPYSLLRLFQDNLFSNYWFATGTPTLLIKLLREQEYSLSEIGELSEGEGVGESAFSTYEIDDLAIIPLLFQTGYLTIKGYQREGNLYNLYYPNHEVEDSFLTYILQSFSQVKKGTTESHLWRLAKALKKKEFAEFFSILEVFLAGIPYDMQLNYEKYYQTIFYLIVRMVGLKASVEERTNKGRIDTVIELEDSFIIFEFKLDGTAEEALEQIKKTNYAQKYQLEGKEIMMAGVNFSTKTRQVSEWKVTDAAGAEIESSEEKASKEQEAQKSEKQSLLEKAEEEQKQALLEQAQGIARHFLAQGLPAELVAQATGLSLEKVQALMELPT